MTDEPSFAPSGTDETEAPLTEHLAEVRSRILICLGTFLVAFLAAYSQTDLLIKLALHPLHQGDPNLKLATLSLTEGFFTTLRLSGYLAFAITLPVILWQVWRFVEPGLLPRERTWFKLLFLPTLGCFITGASFCYFFALPIAIKFFLTSQGDQFLPLFSYAAYIDFAGIFILCSGLLFELPLLIVLLDAAGLLPIEFIKGRRREAIVVAFILGAIFSPPDAVSQICVSVPLIFLLEVGIQLSSVLRRMRNVVE